MKKRHPKVALQTVDKVTRATMYCENRIRQFLHKKKIISGKEVETSDFNLFFHCFDLFSPSRSTIVRLRGEEKVILQLSQQSVQLISQLL